MSEKLENNNKFNFKDKALTLEENIEIHLFSQRELIPSKNLKEDFCYKGMKAIPLFGKEGHEVKGLQLIIFSNKNQRTIILNFLDNEYDKMSSKYHSRILKFDIKKIFCDSYSDFQHYYLSAFSGIKMAFFKYKG